MAALLVHAPVAAARQRGDATSATLAHDTCYTALLRDKVLGERSREHIPALVTSAGWLLGQQPPVELETAPTTTCALIAANGVLDVDGAGHAALPKAIRSHL